MDSDLKRFDERPQQSSNVLSSSKQLDKTHHSEQSEKADAHKCMTFLHVHISDHR